MPSRASTHATDLESNKQMTTDTAETTLNTTTPAAAHEAPQLLEVLTAADLVAAIQAAGCAVRPVSQDGGVHLSSACHGVGFTVLWGNAEAPGRYVDITLSCPLRMQGGQLTEEVFAEWHRSRRFARMSRHADVVALEMDVVAAGGITPAHLTVMLKLWTQMVGQFLAYLRNVGPQQVKSGAGAAEAAAPAKATDTITAMAAAEASAAAAAGA